MCVNAAIVHCGAIYCTRRVRVHMWAHPLRSECLPSRTPHLLQWEAKLRVKFHLPADNFEGTLQINAISLKPLWVGENKRNHERQLQWNFFPLLIFAVYLHLGKKKWCSIAVWEVDCLWPLKHRTGLFKWTCHMWRTSTGWCCHFRAPPSSDCPLRSILT